MGSIMRARRAMLLLLPMRPWCAAVAIASLLAACGGSGSSGFDPAGLEAPLIQQAIDEQRCVSGDAGLVICPSGASVPEPSGGLPSPGPEELSISASVAGGTVDCPEGKDCTLGVAVTAENLPPEAELRLAARVAPDGRWQIGAPLPTSQLDDGSGAFGPVPIEVAGTLPANAVVQVAVLLFVPPPGELPAEVAELRETGALYAFVLQATEAPSDVP
jgi:hypothetical protein